MIYWFTKNGHQFGADASEAWGLITDNDPRTTYHGATDGSIYNATHASAKPKLKLDNLEFVDGKPVVVGGKSEELVDAEKQYGMDLTEAMQKEIARADPNIKPENQDVLVSGGASQGDKNIAIKNILG